MPGNEPRVLIFDDVVYDMPSRYPMPNGAHIRVERDADHAVAVVTEFQPEIIFMDQNLGGWVSGLQAVEEIVRAFGASRPPIYGCSTVRSANQRMIDIGAVGMVQKGEIADFIAAWLEAGNEQAR